MSGLRIAARGVEVAKWLANRPATTRPPGEQLAPGIIVVRASAPLYRDMVDDPDAPVELGDDAEVEVMVLRSAMLAVRERLDLNQAAAVLIVAVALVNEATSDLLNRVEYLSAEVGP